MSIAKQKKNMKGRRMKRKKKTIKRRIVWSEEEENGEGYRENGRKRKEGKEKKYERR